MKRLSFFCLLFISIMLSGCGNSGMTWDIAPVDLRIYVQDIQGNDILNEKNPNNILSNDIKLTFNGEEYPVDNDEDPLNRAYLAHFYGFKIGNTLEGKHFLYFGELDGAENWDASIKLDLGDGDIYDIEFKHNIKWILGNPKISNKYYLNGNKQDTGEFQIIK